MQHWYQVASIAKQESVPLATSWDTLLPFEGVLCHCLNLVQALDLMSDHTVSLAQAVGISSSFFAAGVHALDNDGKNKMQYLLNKYSSTEMLWDFGLQPRGSQAARLPFADGGAVDNLAITPLLRRQVKHIVACVATNDPADGGADNYAKGGWVAIKSCLSDCDVSECTA